MTDRGFWIFTGGALVALALALIYAAVATL